MSQNTVKDNRTLHSKNSRYNSLSLIVENAILENISTSDVVIVTEVEAGGSDSAAGYVTVKPLVRQVDAFGKTIQQVERFKLPYYRLQGGVAAMVTDPEEGDIGLAVYTKRDSSNVAQEQEAPVQPGSFRMFDQADGFYIGGFLNRAPENFLELDQDCNARLKAPMSVSIETKSCTVECETFTVNAEVEAAINAPSWSFDSPDGTGAGYINGDLRQNGTWTSTGNQTASGVGLSTHTHTGVEQGGGNTGGPVAGAGSGSAFDTLGAELAKNPETTDQDRLLLCLPKIAEAEAIRQTTPQDRQGWMHLKNMFQRWFTGEALAMTSENRRDFRKGLYGEPYWVEWDWIIRYIRTSSAYNAFTMPQSEEEPGNIFNQASKNSLGKMLKEQSLLTNKREDFDHISSPWSEWGTNYFNFTVVRNGLVYSDGLTAAMRDFTLRALAKGFSEPNRDGGHTIHVTECAVFAEDGFQFDGGESYGFWDCPGKRFRGLNPVSSILVRNSDFTAFRKRHGCGRDFLVLSNMHKVENFQGMSYEFT